MRRAVAMLAILTIGGLSFAFADPPATSVAPESQGSKAQNSTAEDIADQHSETAPATAAATVAVTPDAAPANPNISASDERMQEKLLRAQGYKPSMRNGEKVFCRREIPLGSRLPTTLKCVTVAEAETMAKEGKETTEHLQRTMVACLQPAMGGCGH
jgi:hypothetical protein